MNGQVGKCSPTQTCVDLQDKDQLTFGCVGRAQFAACVPRDTPCSEGRCLNGVCAAGQSRQVGDKCLVSDGSEGSCNAKLECVKPVGPGLPSDCKGLADSTACKINDNCHAEGQCFQEVCYSPREKDGTSCGTNGETCSSGKCVSPTTTTTTTTTVVDTTTKAANTTSSTTTTTTSTTTPYRPPTPASDCASAAVGSLCWQGGSNNCKVGRCFSSKCLDIANPTAEDGTLCSGSDGDNYDGQCQAGQCIPDEPIDDTVVADCSVAASGATCALTDAPCRVGKCLDDKCQPTTNRIAKNGTTCSDAANNIGSGQCLAGECVAYPSSCEGLEANARCSPGPCFTSGFCPGHGIILCYGDPKNAFPEGTACSVAGRSGRCSKNSQCIIDTTTVASTPLTASTTKPATQVPPDNATSPNTTTTTAAATESTAAPPTETVPRAMPLDDHYFLAATLTLDGVSETEWSKATQVAFEGQMEQIMRDLSMKPDVVAVHIMNINRVSGGNAAKVEVRFEIKGEDDTFDAVKTDFTNEMTKSVVVTTLKATSAGVFGGLSNVNVQRVDQTSSAAAASAVEPSTADDGNLAVGLGVGISVLVVILVAIVYKYRQVPAGGKKMGSGLGPQTSRRKPARGPSGSTIGDPFRRAKLPTNIAKNRYRDILPYDHSAVVLRPLPNDPSSDYINASHIPGFSKERRYIATQGPLASTAGDFWRMVWDEKAELIVMVTRLREGGREKVSQYWPETSGASRQYGTYTITLTNVSEERDWTTRGFLVRDNSGRSRQVQHLQFTSWTDQGVPDSPEMFENFLTRMRPMRGSCTIVHCSAGVGRAGCVISADRQFDRFELQGDLNIFEDVVALRENRPSMVQTPEQYVFLHQTLLDMTTNASSKIMPGVNPDYSEYLRAMDTSAYPNFDAGQNGRKIVHLGDCSIITKGSAPFAGHLAICNDVVWVTKAGNSNALVAAPTPGEKVKYQDVQVEWDEPLLRIELSGT